MNLQRTVNVETAPVEVKVANITLSMYSKLLRPTLPLTVTATETSVKDSFNFPKLNVYALEVYVKEWNVSGVDFDSLGAERLPTYFAFSINPTQFQDEYTNVAGNENQFLMLCEAGKENIHLYYEKPRLVWRADKPVHLTTFNYSFSSPEGIPWEKANVKIMIKYIETSSISHNLVKYNTRAAVEQLI